MAEGSLEHKSDSEAEGQPVTSLGPEKQTPDSEVARWIKNLAALVTIFTALGGLCFTAYQLKLKADAEKDAAKLNRASEADKLQLGIRQLQDQQEARQAQLKQHLADNTMELDKRRLDIQRERVAAANADAKAISERRSSLISHLFGEPGSREGDLASLFEYVDHDKRSQLIIENAMLARLENPRSREEVDLGFRILERIGINAINVVVQANRSARAKYDDCLFQTFHERIAARTKSDLGGSLIPYSVINDTEREIASSSTPLDRGYVFASINRHFRDGQRGVFRLDAGIPRGACQSAYLPDVIERSTVAIGNQLNEDIKENNGKTRVVDLSETYLSKDTLPTYFVGKKYFIINNDVYIGLERTWGEYFTPRDNKCQLKGYAGFLTSIGNQPSDPIDVHFEQLGALISDCLR